MSPALNMGLPEETKSIKSLCHPVTGAGIYEPLSFQRQGILILYLFQTAICSYNKAAAQTVVTEAASRSIVVFSAPSLYTCR